MSLQFVDWGTLLALLGLLGSVVGLAVGFLWRAIATQMKMLNERFDMQDRYMKERFDKQDERFDKQDGRFDKQDNDMAELRSDVGELKTDMAVVKNDLGHVKDDLGQLRDDFGHLRSRYDRMDDNIVQIMRDLGRLEGGQRSASPKEKVGTGGS